MARNALEAVFGALGAGVRGYGRDQQRRYTEEQDRLERENLLARQGVQDELSVANLLERGFGGPQEVRAQGQERARTALQMALQGATAGRGGIAPSMPLPTQVQQIAAQQARPEREQVNVAGRNLSLLETALERGQRQRAEGREEAGAERLARREELELASKLRQGETEARGREDRKTIEMRVRSTGLSPNDRAYQAVLQFARTAEVDPLTGERIYPDDAAVQAFAQRAKTAEASVYGTQPTPKPNTTPQEPTRPELRPNTSRADRWEELRRAGFTAERATAIVNEEMPR